MKALQLAGVIAIVLASPRAKADDAVDPRYSYTVEADATVGYFAAIGSSAHAQPVFGGALSFLGPVAENRQVAVFLRGGGGSNGTGTTAYGALGVGYRSIRDFESLQTRLDLQVLADLSHVTGNGQPGGSKFGLGARFGVGGLYALGHGWRVGLELGISFLAIYPHALAELSPLVTYSW